MTADAGGRIYHPDAFDTTRRVDSYWEATCAPPPGPGHGEIDDTLYDAAIVGGGYTGQSAALHLAKLEDMRVAVMDAGQVGWGASGRNGGFCGLGGAKLDLDALSKQFGVDQTQGFVDAQRDAIQLVTGLSRDEDIDIEATGQGEFCLAHRANRVDALQKERASWARFGLQVAYCSSRELREEYGFNAANHGGLYFPIGFGLHPLKYCYGLYDACVRYGVAWYQNTRAEAVEKAGNALRIHTNRGIVRTRKVIVATNGYTPETLFPELAGCLLPVLSNIVVTRPLEASELKSQGWTRPCIAYDSKHVLHYFRLLNDNRVLFGGRGGIAVDPAGMDKNRRVLSDQFRQYFPMWRDVELDYYWGGFICASYTLTPHIAASAAQPNLFYALAYHGSGVAMATWSGQQVARLVAGRAHDIPRFINRIPKRFPMPAWRKTYLRAALSYYQLMDRL